MSDNMKVWDALRTPPPEALKKIEGGRQSGMTNISPQWRYKAMTEQFGMCGVGWKYEVSELWNVEGSEGQVFAFAKVLLYTADSGGMFTEPIPGIGGAMLIAKEHAGPYSDDEAFKKATTDALSVAMKMLGVGADVYMGMMDGKHTPPADNKPAKVVGTIDPKKGTSGKTAEENKEAGMKKYILDTCMKIADGDEAQAPGVLQEITKDKKGGPISTGIEVNKLTGSVLGWCYGMAKSNLATWEGTHGTEEPVAGADPEQKDIKF